MTAETTETTAMVTTTATIIIAIADAADAGYAVFSDVCAATVADADTVSVVQ